MHTQTSALDNRLQHTLIENLQTIMRELKSKNGICIIVTHREELLSLCDTVLVADGGTVVPFNPMKSDHAASNSNETVSVLTKRKASVEVTTI
jgi:ABC-type bacteriocin/lantibiotic exporter with double-glycine peptidase domain